MSVEEIKAIGAIVIPLATAFLGYLQHKCRQDLNVAHAMLRAHESGKPWQTELRENYRLFRSRKRRKKDAGDCDKAPDQAGD